MTTMVIVYLGYLAVCVTVILLVARTLKTHGVVLMTHKNTEPSPVENAKTQLLVMGFCLVCLGATGYALKYGGDATDAKTAIELVSTKIGGMIFGIGFMHFLMVGIFALVRNATEKIVYSAERAR